MYLYYNINPTRFPCEAAQVRRCFQTKSDAATSLKKLCGSYKKRCSGCQPYSVRRRAHARVALRDDQAHDLDQPQQLARR